jgi:uncharacterized Zn finger protein
MSWWSYKPYVSAAQRRAKAERAAKKLAKGGRTLSPVKIVGRAMATTFWGKSWCDNLESYSDFENRLPRGRTYARNGSVLDLQIEPGRIKALVSGSELYKVTIDITTHPAAAWKELKSRCAGQIGTLVELLQGKLSKSVMDLVTERDGGLFPKPKEIRIKCSCPDWAGLCKHAAAVLYGVGARFDHEPELLFTLRKVDHLELIGEAGSQADFAKTSRGKKVLAETELADVFGIELAGSDSQSAQPTEVADSQPKAAKAPGRRAKAVVSTTEGKAKPTRRLSRKPKVVTVAVASNGDAALPRKTRKRNSSTPRSKIRSAK